MAALGWFFWTAGTIIVVWVGWGDTGCLLRLGVGCSYAGLLLLGWSLGKNR